MVCMTTTEYCDPYPQRHELSNVDEEALDAACDGLYQGRSSYPQGVVRYCFYRRKGFTKAEALAYALAWSRNMVEQARRRLSHDTGAEGWATRVDA